MKLQDGLKKLQDQDPKTTIRYPNKADMYFIPINAPVRSGSARAGGINVGQWTALVITDAGKIRTIKLDDETPGYYLSLSDEWAKQHQA